MIGSATRSIDPRNESSTNVHQEREQPPPVPKPPSMAAYLLLTAAVALVSGALGAMSYSHFYGSKPAGSSSVQSSVNRRRTEKSTAGDTPSARGT